MIHPVLYRWDSYGHRKAPTPWLRVRSEAMLQRACRALTMPNERIRVVFDNGQEVVYRLRFGKR